MKSISSYAAIALSNSQKSKLLEKLSYHDVLTGLENRRAFVEYSELLMNDLVFYKSVSLIIADMNHLKSINDNIGHIEGDRYLIELSNILSNLYKDNKIFRLGGDEFCVIIPNISESEVKNSIQKVNHLCKNKNYKPYPLSLAIGYSYSNDKIDINKLFIEAETKMYDDKADYYKKNRLDIEENYKLYLNIEKG